MCQLNQCWPEKLSPVYPQDFRLARVLVRVQGGEGEPEAVADEAQQDEIGQSHSGAGLKHKLVSVNGQLSVAKPIM